MRSAITTHVLDAAAGRPAAGVPVVLDMITADNVTTLAMETTDDDGRVASLGPETVDAGTYRLTFATAAYFAGRGVDAFYPEVVITFSVVDPAQHYHVPVLLSPYAYSTYRGS